MGALLKTENNSVKHFANAHIIHLNKKRSFCLKGLFFIQLTAAAKRAARLKRACEPNHHVYFYFDRLIFFFSLYLHMIFQNFRIYA